ncbi:MAG: trigger factor [Bacteroidetes bacterium]|nr:trigger factor [Bacteroidota bacterium]
MNIVKENTGELSALLRINLVADDYQPQIEKVLREQQKKASMPGFRPGKVPFSLVKKMYGKSVMVDEINKFLNDTLYNYLKENNIDILGNPLPSEEQTPDVDWDNQTEFEFCYEIGLVPKVEISVSDKQKLNYYNITVSDEVVEKYLGDIRKRYGKFSTPETSEDGDLLYGEFKELDDAGNVIENGITNKASLSLEFIKSKTIKKSLIGLKKDDELTIDVAKATQNLTETAAILAITKEEAEKLKSNFKFTLLGISRVEPAELNEELFEKIYRNDAVKTEAELRDRIKKDAEISFVQESQKKFMSDAVELLIKEAKIQLPDEFLKKWLLTTNEKITPEQLVSEYQMYSDSMRWQLIENRLIIDNEIKVTEEEIKAYFKDFINKQLAQYGQEATPEDKLDEIAENLMKNKEEVKKVNDKLFDDKLYNHFETNFKVTKKDVTYEEFVKLASEK